MDGRLLLYMLRASLGNSKIGLSLHRPRGVGRPRERSKAENVAARIFSASW